MHTVTQKIRPQVLGEYARTYKERTHEKSDDY